MSRETRGKRRGGESSSTENTTGCFYSQLLLGPVRNSAATLTKVRDVMIIRLSVLKHSLLYCAHNTIFGRSYDRQTARGKGRYSSINSSHDKSFKKRIFEQ
jgi:hypothetical protein